MRAVISVTLLLALCLSVASPALASPGQTSDLSASWLARAESWLGVLAERIGRLLDLPAKPGSNLDPWGNVIPGSDPPATPPPTEPKPTEPTPG
ncbi:MAG TPA: hypothetical protein PK413_07025 [Thermoanaerobaculia bacterium]|nr:hypothetical protein [Thermoanaerobaculia bacterium]